MSSQPQRLRDGSFLVLAVLLLGASNAVAETPQEKGLQIAEEADRRDRGFGD
jgi:hypothetical protein